jgi:hypothetical protein
MQVSREQSLYSLVVGHSNSASKGSLHILGRGYQTPTPAKPWKYVRKFIEGDIGSLTPKIPSPFLINFCSF